MKIRSVCDVAAELTTPDYSLIGFNSTLAIKRGLAEADWYQCYVPRATMRELLERRDGPAIRDTLLWLGLILGAATTTWRLWGTWWAVVPYLIYCTLYASTSDSRWHESGHGTAFKTDWMNIALYEIASFMVMRESIVWRWSHTRHHSDTIIVGRDPEIAVPRPPSILRLLCSFFHLTVYPNFIRHICIHALGRITAEEKTFIAKMEFPKVYVRARIYLAIYTAVIILAFGVHSTFPLMMVGLSNLFGTWLLVVYGLTQHAGLAENVLDHRLNCRTVYMNPVHRFLYWNMSYHIEHHMFPLVPYHALPKLHELIREDCPPAYPSLFAAWCEIIPTVLKQVKDPAYHVKRTLPEPNKNEPKVIYSSNAKPDSQGWVPVCPAQNLHCSDAVRFDLGKKSYALYRDASCHLYATDGFCTHGNVHLSEGLVIDGTIECSKHNGRFHLADGSPARAPICRGLATYPVCEIEGFLQINVAKPGGVGTRPPKSYRFKVVSNINVATFIKELVLISDQDEEIPFLPGEYMQFDIPIYDEIRFSDFSISEPYRIVWREQHVFDLVSRNPSQARRNNYSIASNREIEGALRFNVRIATPPPGQSCPTGVGSAYIFNLTPGDSVTAIGPFGDFHIKPTHREMVYIGGGAGMAPLRSHISYLLETEQSARKISFWYGARSQQELFYVDYFNSLVEKHPNFAFHLALSAPLPTDAWDGPVGLIHEVLFNGYLGNHPDPQLVEYYLCGPPMMIKASTRMLENLGVPLHQIVFDEF